MSYSQAWLDNQASIRGIFIEAAVYDVVAATEILVYIASVGYITEDALISFDPIVNGSSIKITESMSVDGGLSFSFGDIELYNGDGEKDDWLDSSKYIWANRAIQVYLGDPLWVSADLATFKSTFKKIFDGLISDVDSKNINTLNIKVRDKLEKLNTPLTETKLGTYGTWAGGQPNADTIKPLIFGEVHNIEPLLVDPSILEYMFHDGSAESVIELRDNGVPIYSTPTLTSGATISLSTGKFTLAHPLVGQLTASIQGTTRSINLSTGSEVAAYTNTVADLIALIVMKYGKQGISNLTAAEIDLSNFASFKSYNSQAVGIVINDRDNVLTVCQQLADSVGAQLYFNKLGLLQLIRLGDPVSGPTTILESDIVQGTLSISMRTEVVASNTIRYCKNWTVQEGLLTGIPEAHKDMFATEWFTKTYTHSATQTLYKLNTATVPKETLLLVGSEATAEASRLNVYFRTPRTIYKFTGNSSLLSLELAQSVYLVHSRYNLYNSGTGTYGQVYSLTPDWVEGTVDVEVII